MTKPIHQVKPANLEACGGHVEGDSGYLDGCTVFIGIDDVAL